MFSAILGEGDGVIVGLRELFFVRPYEAPVADRDLAERMANLCSFHRAA